MLHGIINFEVFTKMEKEYFIDLFAVGSFAIPKLLLENYKKIGLNEEEFMFLLHIYSAIESGNLFPTPEQLAERMSCSKDRCMEILKYLIQRGYLEIKEKNDDGIVVEIFSIRPLWEKLYYFLYDQKKKKALQESELAEINIYTLFEQEFGRPLSPMECETLKLWLDHDHYSPLLIKAALREAVMSGKLNFRYIDRILFEWQKKGIETIEQARDQGQKFRAHQRIKMQTKPAKQESSSVPLYNWLES